MVATHLENFQELTTLIVVEVPGRSPRRYQGWQFEDYFYQGKPYSYISLDGGAGTTRSIGLGSTGRTVNLANLDARVDSLRPIRDWLNEEDGWRKATVTLTHLWPNDLLAQPMVERHEVISSGIQGAEASIVLKGAADATNARVPSLLLTRGLAPELPNNPPGRV